MFPPSILPIFCPRLRGFLNRPTIFIGTHCPFPVPPLLGLRLSLAVSARFQAPARSIRFAPVLGR